MMWLLLRCPVRQSQQAFVDCSYWLALRPQSNEQWSDFQYYWTSFQLKIYEFLRFTILATNFRFYPLRMGSEGKCMIPQTLHFSSTLPALCEVLKITTNGFKVMLPSCFYRYKKVHHTQILWKYFTSNYFPIYSFPTESRVLILSLLALTGLAIRL